MFSLQTLTYTAIYNESPLELKSKLIDKILSEMPLEDILSRPPIISKIKDNICTTIDRCAPKRDEQEMNKVKQLIHQSSDSLMMKCMFSLLYDKAYTLLNNLSMLSPSKWKKFVMEDGKMIILRKNQAATDATDFDFHRDIVDSKFDTSQLFLGGEEWWNCTYDPRIFDAA